jgi:hypothetical protein
MPAILKLDQVGLPAGTPGEARNDGLLTGAEITATSTGAGSSHSLEILWVPDGDTNTAASFAHPTGTTWTWTPTPGCPGTYLLRLTVDGDVQERTFRMLTPRLGLAVPALNELADPTGSLVNNGAAVLAASQDNAPETSVPPGAALQTAPASAGKPFSGGNYGGWYRLLRNQALRTEDLAAGREPMGFLFPDDAAQETLNPGLDTEIS